MQLSVQWATIMSRICLMWWGLTPILGSSYTVITTEAMTDLLARLFEWLEPLSQVGKGEEMCCITVHLQNVHF